jgi:hypothetical protein
MITPRLHKCGEVTRRHADGTCVPCKDAYTQVHLDRLIQLEPDWRRKIERGDDPKHEYILTMTNRQWKNRFGHLSDYRIWH